MTTPSVEQQIQNLAHYRRYCEMVVKERASDTPLILHPTGDWYSEVAGALRDAESILDTLSQSLTEAQGEIGRLTEENKELLARSGKPDMDRDFSIHAPTDTDSL